jgi:hypothetical protein
VSGQPERSGYRVTRLWRDDKGRDWATTNDYAEKREAFDAFHAECKWPGQVDLYDVARGEVISSNSWPDGWKPTVRHEQRRLTTDG